MAAEAERLLHATEAASGPVAQSSAGSDSNAPTRSNR